jgi:hypothetical protein
VNFLGTLRRGCAHFRNSSIDARLIELCHRLPKFESSDKENGKIVLVQAAPDPYYLALFSVLLCEMNKYGSISPELFVFQSIPTDGSVGVKARLKWTTPFAWLTTRQWLCLYEGVAPKVGYRSISWSRPIEDIGAYFDARKVWKSLLSLADLEKLSVEGIACGDLILDSYLRFKPAATVNINDPYLLYLIWQTHRDVHRATRYFKSKRPAVFLSTYSTYVQHGIAVRAALKLGVRVVTFGNFQQLGKVLSPSDFSHTKNAENYRDIFFSRLDKDLLLNAANIQMEKRLSGGADSATSYMIESAHIDRGISCPDVRNSVVVYLHDFFDSPHIYPGMIFPDFWTWICFTIETLKSTGLTFWLKRHPNQISMSKRVVDDLQNKYENLAFIPDGVNTQQLVVSGMACVVTVYGTIAHEAAFLGVPSIACAQHPHVAYDFTKTASNLLEYETLLRNALSLKFVDKLAMKRQALEFYAMHNLDLPPTLKFARERMTNLWKCAHAKGASGKEIGDAANSLACTPGFRQFAKSLTK